MAATSVDEQLGTRAVLRYGRMSAFKVRPVLDLIRGRDLEDAQDILRFSERDAARVVAKLLASAVANAENNDAQSADELYVSACYADEATTMKRWRPRARGRATRIRKRTCHITVVVSRLPDERLRRRQAEDTGDAAARRARRVAGARRQRVAASRAAEAEAAEEAGVPEVGEEAAPFTGTRSDETGASGDAAPSVRADDVEEEEEEAEGGADAESAAEAQVEPEALADEAAPEPEPAAEETPEEQQEQAKPRRRTRAKREKRDE